MLQDSGMPYIHLDATNHYFLGALDTFLIDRGALDSVLLFTSEHELDEALDFIIGNFSIGVRVFNYNTRGIMNR